MKVRILGTAAGGGLPQWNCACPGCVRARRKHDHRSQDGLAVSGDGHVWYLLNASPDLRTQLLRSPELTAGPGVRDTPVRGVLLTSAEIDHAMGVLALREAEQLALYATAPVLAALPALPMLDHYTKLERRIVTCGTRTTVDGGLDFEAFALGGKRPRYAVGRSPAPDWVVGYRFTEHATGRVLVYAPCLAEWMPSFAAAITGAHLVLLDGTFYSDGEMAGHGAAPRSARQMGHLPIGASLPLLAAHPRTQFLYTHLNNTNPVADPRSAQHATVTAAGAGIAPEGELLDL